jgi:Ulp1 family protease
MYESCPQQNDGKACGIHVIMNAIRLAIPPAEGEPDQNAHGITHMRKKILMQIGCKQFQSMFILNEPIERLIATLPENSNIENDNPIQIMDLTTNDTPRKKLSVKRTDSEKRQHIITVNTSSVNANNKETYATYTRIRYNRTKGQSPMQ